MTKMYQGSVSSVPLVLITMTKKPLWKKDLWPDEKNIEPFGYSEEQELELKWSDL